MEVSELESLYKKEEPRIIERWSSLLRFKSISTDKAYNDDCGQCASWLVAELQKIGFKAELANTSSKPIVFAELNGDSTRPTLLFYGHYDVQPPDPLDKWLSPPFEPTLRDGRMFARGASDNKGQLTFVISALETLIKNNSLKANIKLLIEGEEESGSRGLEEAIPKIASRIKADLLYVSDSSMAPSGAPTITMGLRGMAALSILLKAYKSDLHSGIFGGALKNPVTELCRIVASFHDSSGKVVVPGFYDDLILHSKEEAQLAQTGCSKDSDLKEQQGTLPTGGETNFSVAERVGFRPTIEVNGLHGGYGGEGGKTIIPREALLKISARLGTGQDPERIGELLRKYIAQQAPSEMELVFEGKGHGGPALRLDPKSECLKPVVAALEKMSSQSIAYRWEGGSIPVLSALRDASGAEPVLVAFGKTEDNWHAPNESLALDRFKQGYLFSAIYLSSL